jgi:hypothetical protein
MMVYLFGQGNHHSNFQTYAKNTGQRIEHVQHSRASMTTCPEKMGRTKEEEENTFNVLAEAEPRHGQEA